MGRGILLWLLGVPIPIILLLAFLRQPEGSAAGQDLTKLATSIVNDMAEAA